MAVAAQVGQAGKPRPGGMRGALVPVFIRASVTASVPRLVPCLGARRRSRESERPGRPVGEAIGAGDAGVEQQASLARHQQVGDPISGEVAAVEPVVGVDVDRGDARSCREAALAQVRVDQEVKLLAAQALGVDQHQVLGTGAAGGGKVGAHLVPEMTLGVHLEGGRSAAAAAVARQQEQPQVALDEDAELRHRADRERRPAVPGEVRAVEVLPVTRQQRPGLDRRLAGGGGEQQRPQAALALRLGTHGEARRGGPVCRGRGGGLVRR